MDREANSCSKESASGRPAGIALLGTEKTGRSCSPEKVTKKHVFFGDLPCYIVIISHSFQDLFGGKLGTSL